MALTQLPQAPAQGGQLSAADATRLGLGQDSGDMTGRIHVHALISSKRCGLSEVAHRCPAESLRSAPRHDESQMALPYACRGREKLGWLMAPYGHRRSLARSFRPIAHRNQDPTLVI